MKINRKQLESDYKKTCLEKDQDVISDHGYLKCECCGVASPLSHAHIISKRHKEFFAVKDNIKILCMASNGKIGCHQLLDDYRLTEFKKRDLGHNENTNFTDSIIDYLIDNGHGNRADKLLKDVQCIEAI